MGDESQVINLRMKRKEKARDEARATADVNAAKHGRSKAQRLLEAMREEKLRRHLDQHRFEE